METPNNPGRLQRFTQSSTFKFFCIAFLLLLFLIPSFMISELIKDRQRLHVSATQEIANKWGRPQTLVGPVISVLLSESDHTDSDDRHFAHLFPDDLQVKAELVPEQRYRGIYQAVVYTSRVTVTGVFRAATLQRFRDRELKRETEAVVQMGVSDVRGLDGVPQFAWNDSILPLEPGLKTRDLFGNGFHGLWIFSDVPAKDIHFSVTYTLKGSEAMQVVPIARNNRVNISGPWPDPSFHGQFLPTDPEVSDNGFNATWTVSEFNRAFPQMGSGRLFNSPDFEAGELLSLPAGNRFKDTGYLGVRLLQPVNHYKKTERVSKYDVLFVVLILVSFFLIEVVAHRPIHLIQYLLIGVAVLLFYLLLLSISEHLAFAPAYLIAAGAVWLLITSYTWQLVRSAKITVIIGLVQAALYSYFYTLLLLDQFALLAGSIGLFVVLAVLMRFTRKLDWYS